MCIVTLTAYGKILLPYGSRKWQHTPILLPGWETQWTEEPEGDSPWGHRESDTTQWPNDSHYQYQYKFSRSVMSNSWQQARPPCPSPTPRVHPNPCPLSQWCHPIISSSAVPFSSCPQSFPASGSFPMSQLIASGGQSIRVSASASVLPMNTQDWFPLGWTGWISLQSKGCSRIFSNTAVEKHQFFGAQLSL